MYESTPVAARKYHYWRGFKAALLITVPVIIVLCVACNMAIDALLK